MNRRGRARFRTDLTVNVALLDLPDLSLKGRLANLSAHGLSIIIAEELPEGCTVRVEWGATSFVGRTIYCRPQGREFLVGLEVDNPVYDTKKQSRNGESVR